MAGRIFKDAPIKAPDWELDRVVGQLRVVRERWRQSQGRLEETGGRELPSREAIGEIFENVAAAMFPMRLGPPDLRQESEDFFVGRALDAALNALYVQTRLELRYEARLYGLAVPNIDARALDITRNFAAALPGLRAILDADVEAAYRGDPAARSVDEVLLCYPGVLALIYHRLAHELYRLGAPLIARVASENAHSKTGIDIHPGAEIGPRFFIDHGVGVVIGETTIIGAGVRLYQAVTLGARSFPADENGVLQKNLPRHPIVEDEVVIYAGATILGRITIGRGSTIGGNVWLTRSVPPGSQVTQANTRHELVSDGAGI